MNIKKIVLILACICFGSNTGLFAQKNYIKSGDKAYDEGDYYNASVYFRKALDSDSSKVDLAYKYAEACRKNNDYTHAERWYKFVFEKDKGPQQLYPTSQFWLASMKKFNGKYVEAKKMFKQYASKHKADANFFSKKAKHEVTACDFGLSLSKVVEKNYNVMHMDTNVNSLYEDFAPYQLADTIFYFSSIRNPYTVKDAKGREVSTTHLAKLYKSYRKDSIWSETRSLKEFYNIPDQNNSNCAFSPDKKRFYFTRQKQSGANAEASVMFVSEFKDKKWQEPVKLPESINMPGFNNTQPCIGKGSTGGDVLYFVSNRTGGQGGLDIWASVYTNGKYTQPVNLGDKINTIDDEVTPSFDNMSETLYFSSGWHNGLGGMDIFKSHRDGNGTWSDPKNLGYPINTSYNDVYFTINENGTDGYFASNRIGTISTKGETCCNDIYYFQLADAKRLLDSLKQAEVNAKLLSEELKTIVPVTLYFDNDAPDPKSQDTITALDYETTVTDYLTSKPDYEKAFVTGLTGPAKENAVKDINQFFNDYVDKGFNQLNRLGKLLVTTLESGRSVTLTLKGYCSPLAMDDYNRNLAKRRLSSLRNFLKEYDHNSLEKYLNNDAENYAKLVLIEEAIGESEASKEISDNPNDRKNSVYSRVSALERKIQVTNIVVSEKSKLKRVIVRKADAPAPKEEAKTDDKKDDDKKDAKAENEVKKEDTKKDDKVEDKKEDTPTTPKKKTSKKSDKKEDE